MIAGWYHEEITDVKDNSYIRYRVTQSFPAVRQDFTEISFSITPSGKTRVIWMIEIGVPLPWAGVQKILNRAAGKMAGTLYNTILTAGRKELERETQQKL